MSTPIKPVVINQRTLLPISLVIAIMGGVVWLASLNFKIEAQAKALDQQDVQVHEFMKILNDINARTIRIETQIKFNSEGE